MFQEKVSCALVAVLLLHRSITKPIISTSRLISIGNPHAKVNVSNGVFENLLESGLSSLIQQGYPHELPYLIITAEPREPDKGGSTAEDFMSINLQVLTLDPSQGLLYREEIHNDLETPYTWSAPDKHILTQDFPGTVFEHGSFFNLETAVALLDEQGFHGPWQKIAIYHPKQLIPFPQGPPPVLQTYYVFEEMADDPATVSVVFLGTIDRLARREVEPSFKEPGTGGDGLLGFFRGITRETSTS